MDENTVLSALYVFAPDGLPTDPVAYGYVPVETGNGETAYFLPGESAFDADNGRKRPVYDKEGVLYDLNINRRFLDCRGWTVYPVFDIGTKTISMFAQKIDPVDGMTIIAPFRAAVNHERANMPNRFH